MLINCSLAALCIAIVIAGADWPTPNCVLKSFEPFANSKPTLSCKFNPFVCVVDFEIVVVGVGVVVFVVVLIVVNVVFAGIAKSDNITFAANSGNIIVVVIVVKSGNTAIVVESFGKLN